jgi:DNA polymerase III gamma/tau subunit
MTLYLKYRPQSLSEIQGNEDLVEGLTATLAKKEHPKSYLLSGDTGCGKTTIGRIIANMVGCQGADYREVDSADFRGIDSIRDIRKQSQFMPLEGKCKVWLLDEVHQLSRDAQNALLKALEDTPRHVYYILCTTDPQKLLPTIRGRCSQFKVELLKPGEMRKLLMTVVKAENEKLLKPVYEAIIESAKGHPRNALQILDQVLSTEPDARMRVAVKAQEESVQAIELCRAIISGAGWSKVSKILTELKDQDAEGIRRLILGYCSSVLLKSENNQVGLIMEEFREPMYDIGFPGVVLACYSVVCGNDT